MNAFTFSTAVSYLQQIPCGLKQQLFDNQPRPFCDWIRFMGRKIPLIELAKQRQVGIVEEVTIIDDSTREYLKVRTYELFKPDEPEMVDAMTNLYQIIFAVDPKLEELKAKGYREVANDACKH